MLEKYTVKQNDVEFELIEIDLSDIYDFAPQTTACQLLKTLANAYETLKNIVEESQIIIETSPDVGISCQGVEKESTATALAWITKLVPYMSIREALKFVKQFEDFDEDEVTDILKRVKIVLRLWDGYESCYAIQLKNRHGG